MSPRHCFALLLAALAGISFASAQDIPIGVTYVCSGEHIYIENCNIRDTSDTSTCMVAHPDHLTPTGLNTYTYLTRGALKKLLPTCQQPSTKQLADAQAFQKKQQELYNAAVARANPPQPAASAAPGANSATPISINTQSMTPEQRQMNRCITSGRLAASCTGNGLMGMFTSMISSVVGSAGAKEAAAGPNMAGVFEGPGNWRLDFVTDGVLVNCAFLSPDQHRYAVKFEPDRTTLVIDTTPKPLVLTFKADGSITGPGPVTIDGVIAGGYVNDTPANATQKDQYGNLYDASGNRVLGTESGHTNFVPRRTTCPALSLASKGSVGVETMETNLLKTAFGGDKGPPTPTGIRMHGIFAAPTGFSVQFFPESAILGCGPDAARAYPYTVRADGPRALVKIDAPDHPLTLTYRTDGSLDPGAGSYQVHARRIVGQDANDDFTFAPYEQTCNLAALVPSDAIPSTGGTAAMTAASPVSSASSRAASGPANATLSIVSGLTPLSGQPNPLAAHPYILLRSSFSDTIANAVAIPAGSTPHKYLGFACGTRAPDCQKMFTAIQAGSAGSVRADASGSGTFPAVPAGTYYLMISARVNNQAYAWEQPVELHPGSNTVTLSLANAAPIN